MRLAQSDMFAPERAIEAFKAATRVGSSPLRLDALVPDLSAPEASSCETFDPDMCHVRFVETCGDNLLFIGDSQGESPIYMCLGDRLKLERKRLGLTQAQLAKVGGVTATSQNEYENPEKDRVPNAKYLAAIAIEGADVGFILTGKASGSTLPPNEAALIELFRRAGQDEQGMILRMMKAAVGAADQARPKPSELLPEHALLHEMFNTLLLAVDLSEGKDAIAEYLADTLQSGMQVIEDPRWIVQPEEDASERGEEPPARKRA